MSKYGRLKSAWFEDGVIIEAERRCTLKRAVKTRRQAEGYRGRVWFKNSQEWFNAYGEYLMAKYPD